MDGYEKKADNFLIKTNSTIDIKFKKYGYHFLDDKKRNEKRDIYEITLNHGNRKFIFDFGNSINNSSFKLINTITNKELKYKWFDDLTFNKDRDLNKLKQDIKNKLYSLSGLKIEPPKEPTKYDVLSCLDVFEGSFNDFCEEFGYDYDSIKAEIIYKRVMIESDNLQKLYNDEEIELLKDIV